MAAAGCASEPAPAAFHRRGGGLTLAEIGPVAYWLCEFPDVGDIIRVRLVARWDVDGKGRRVQVGPEWEQVSRDDDVRVARERIDEHHDRITSGQIAGRAE